MKKLLLTAMLLSGCGLPFPTEYTGPERATALVAFLNTCNEHGGVEYFKENLYTGSDYIPRIKCGDGLELEFHYTRKQK